MNIPNMLSLMRLLMVPMFPIVYNAGVPHAHLYAAGVYFLAAATDVIDGWLARRNNQITKLGRILDPMADKAMAFTVLLTITIAGVVHWWAVLVLFAKEVVMGVGAMVLVRKRDDVFAAVEVGKTATAVFFVVCLVLTVFPAIPLLWSNLMLAIAVGLNVIALVYYLYLYFNKQEEKI